MCEARNIYAIIGGKRIACKSDPAELPKSRFSVNNITEKFAKLFDWFGAFFSILNDLNGLEGGPKRQPGSRKCQFGCEGHHKRESPQRPPQTSNLWNQLWQGMWIDLIFEPLKWYSCSRIFSEQSYWKVDYPSSAVTDLQAIRICNLFICIFQW